MPMNSVPTPALRTAPVPVSSTWISFDVVLTMVETLVLPRPSETRSNSSTPVGRADA